MKALNSIENLLHPSETNRIKNYERFQVVSFKILAKSAKMKIKCMQMTSGLGKAVKMKIGLKTRLK